MMEALTRRYPVGIQTFKRIREEGYVYVDKTDLMWQVQRLSPFIFLSRPRRFGKSLLTTTFASFFRAEKELFEGLKVMELEKEWIKYPVIHLDLSVTKGVPDAKELQRKLTLLLEPYLLSIPNQEVRVGFTKGLMPTYLGLSAEDARQGFAAKCYRALKKDDLDLALREMQTYFAGLPYIEGFKKKLEDVTKVEGFYEWTFYLIFSMLNQYVRTQVKTIHGRADMVIQMPDVIYVIELKINGTAQEALDQINSKGYAIPYQTDGRPVRKAGISFSTETLAIEGWVIA